MLSTNLYSQADARVHTIERMAALYNCSSDCSVAVTGKVEPLLFRLPLELRQHIYAIIFGPRRLVDLHICPISPRSRSMIYRPKSEKPHENDDLENDKDIDGESEKKLSESDMEDAYRFSEDSVYERRTSILGVSRAISNEALDVLYGQNNFVVYIPLAYHEFPMFGVANLRRIHYLLIMTRPMAIFYESPHVFDPQLWLPLLEGLLQFRFVAQQPSGGYYDAPTLEEDSCDWTTWLDPILKYFSTNLPKTTAVSLDDDGHAETSSMMDKHFDPNHWELVLRARAIFEGINYPRQWVDRRGHIAPNKIWDLQP